MVIFKGNGTIPDTDMTLVLAWFLTVWTIFTFYMWIGSFATNKALTTLFTLLLITFILLDVGHFTNPAWNKIGGLFGLATAICAWYASAAGISSTRCTAGWCWSWLLFLHLLSKRLNPNWLQSNKFFTDIVDRTAEQPFWGFSAVFFLYR